MNQKLEWLAKNPSGGEHAILAQALLDLGNRLTKIETDLKYIVEWADDRGHR
jgi:hypothetical protein